MTEHIKDENIKILTDMQKDTLGEIGNICMSSSATTLHDILGRRVTITTPNVTISALNKLSHEYNIPYVIVDVAYTEGVLGKSLLIMKIDDVKTLTSIMLDDNKPEINEELTEMELSAIGEVMNQMMGASSTALANLIYRKINISPPNINIINIAEDKEKLLIQDDTVVLTKFKMEVEDLLDTEIILLMPYEFARDLIREFLKANNVEENEEIEIEESNAPVDNFIKQSDERQGQVKKAKIKSFDNEYTTGSLTDNMNLLLDIPLNITVELGRTKKYLKDILELSVGSIISLEKPAGDLIDVLVNGKLIAKGEVVVIDDNFGVRITDIISSDIRQVK